MTGSVLLEIYRKEHLDMWANLENRPVNTWIRDIVSYHKADFKLAPLTRFLGLIRKYSIHDLDATQQQIDAILAGDKPENLTEIIYSASKHDKVSTGDKFWGAMCGQDGKDIAVKDQKKVIKTVVDEYEGCSFWPNRLNNGIAKSEFWSENHILLYLSSAVLFKQRCDEMGRSSGHVTDYEVELLKDYLQAHTSMTNGVGVYEVLSGTYLPHSMKALLNLYDFSYDPDIKHFADLILCAIARQFLLVTNASGVCSLTATCRAPHKNDYLMKTSGHHTDDLIKFLLPDHFGCLEEAEHISDFGEFLLTSSWTHVRQDASVLGAWDLRDFQAPMNHSIDCIKACYHTEERNATPFYCSAGLLMHPDFVEGTSLYRSACDLAGSFMDVLKYLSSLHIPLRSVSQSIGVLTCSQKYCDINLHVYKTPSRGGVLTSFLCFNPGKLLFQQVPWCANVDGVGVFTVCPLNHEAMAEYVQNRQHGAVSHLPTGMLSNIFKLMTPEGKSPPEVSPCVSQERNIALVAYSLPGDMRADMKAFWPRAYFANEIGDDDPHRDGTWWLGERVGIEQSTYVGLLCSKKSTTVPAREKHGLPEYDRKVHVDQDCVYRVAHGKKCAFVCVLGDSSEYPSLTDFSVYVHTLSLCVDDTDSALIATVSRGGKVIVTAVVED